MLKSLRIQNYAIIQQLDISFNEGLSIITGETGAGKSILLGAMSLILGQRADTGVLKDKSKKCLIEGSFDISNYDLQNFFATNDIDFDALTIIRREINENGKSRAFINDTPVNLNLLKELGLQLVDIHSQHENLALSDNIFQLKIIDSIASHTDLLNEYQIKFRQYNKLNADYNNLIEKSKQAKADFDYYSFQFEQLFSAKLSENEQTDLEHELEVLTHSEEIKTNLTKTSQLLSGDGNTILNLVKESLSATQQISNFFEPSKNLNQRLTSIYIELKDIASEAENLSESIEHDSSQIDKINARLDLIYSFQQKHRVATVKELLDLQKSFEQKLLEINNSDDQINQLQKELESCKENLQNLCNRITKNRQKVTPQIEKQIKAVLIELGIPNAIFKVDFQNTNSFTPLGCDKVTFLFTANKNSDLQDISKVASGGEMSRLMLAIKSIISQSKDLPTIIFDEIDAGVSGDIADKMGNILRKMSANMQVINITHLPQIAAKGESHYLVYKESTSKDTFTNIRLLDKNERIREIAKMLSGAEITETALKNAEELLH